jgi:serine/threonine-protein kinase
MEGMRPSPDNVDTIIPGRAFQIPAVIPTPSETAAPVAAERSGDIARSTGLGDTDSRKSSKLKQLPEGTVLNNRYEVVRKIGGGGMGAVYLASDNNLGGVLRAVKEMVQAHIEEDQQEKAINDFKRESMILSTLDHPSIPTIYDYFYDAEESRFYLVMKYISGGDLASKLRSSADGKIEELIVTEWAIQLTDVLNYLHNQPSTIVYRDLKPSNIMLDGNSSRVMLIDFGIARNISQKEEKGVTAVGTMGYAPPELFSGNVEPRSDIYSLGSTMFHLLTGADPQSNPLLIFDFQKNPRPRQINSRLSDQMERILMRTVEYNAEARFSSAGELKAVLEEHLTNLRSGNLTFGVTEAPVSVSLANQSVFCGFCGQRIVATDLFCAFCGAKQPIAQQGVHSEIYHKASATARLVIEGTSELSAPIYALQKDDNLIGRRDPMSNIFPEVDLSKYDPQTKISRRHAKVWRDGTSFMLEDLGSSNGTVVEGAANSIFKLPAHQPYKLSSGDRIKIGDTRLHFVVG